MRHTRKLVAHCECQIQGKKSLAIALDAVSVGEGGLHHDESGQETDETHEGHEDVGGGEVRPGFHRFVVVEPSIAEKPPEETTEWPVLEVAQ